MLYWIKYLKMNLLTQPLYKQKMVWVISFFLKIISLKIYLFLFCNKNPQITLVIPSNNSMKNDASLIRQNRTYLTITTFIYTRNIIYSLQLKIYFSNTTVDGSSVSSNRTSLLILEYLWRLILFLRKQSVADHLYYYQMYFAIALL